MGGSKIGLGIFASCTGSDVIDYASAILVKLPEMVVEMRKAKLQLDAGVSDKLVEIVRPKNGSLQVTIATRAVHLA